MSDLEQNLAEQVELIQVMSRSSGSPWPRGVAGLVHALVRWRQNRLTSRADDEATAD